MLWHWFNSSILFIPTPEGTNRKPVTFELCALWGFLLFTAPGGPADSFLVCNEPMRHLTSQLQLPLLTICDAAEAKRPDPGVQTINRRPAEAPLSCGRGRPRVPLCVQASRRACSRTSQPPNGSTFYSQKCLLGEEFTIPPLTAGIIYFKIPSDTKVTL